MSEKLTLEIIRSLDKIDAADWNALANPNGERRQNKNYNPFLSHEFLKALEDTNCVGEGTGWYPHHALLHADGELVGAAPLYIKTHSQGEYVFDHGWADALERAGGRYYPKLQGSVPFTPASGPRLLVKNEAYRTNLAAALAQMCDELGASSLHATFLTKADRDSFETAGYLIRNDQQFHFTDNNFGDFEGFLESLASRKRKAIRKERKGALENGISIKWITGDAITEDHWDAFYRFYMDTGMRKWGQPYLTREFFSAIGETMPDDILLIFAERGSNPIAGAINFIGGDTLYGRNWGCTEHHPFLHFEVCYYQAIDFALANGLNNVEAGAQGAHKLSRGYLPVTTYSAHHVGNPSFRAAIEDYLEHERDAVARENAALTEAGPYKKSTT